MLYRYRCCSALTILTPSHSKWHVGSLRRELSIPTDGDGIASIGLDEYKKNRAMEAFEPVMQADMRRLLWPLSLRHDYSGPPMSPWLLIQVTHQITSKPCKTIPLKSMLIFTLCLSTHFPEEDMASIGLPLVSGTSG
jgi:hypothetical protein